MQKSKYWERLIALVIGEEDKRPQPEREAVSASTYARLIGRRAALFIGGAALIAVAAIGFIVCVGLIIGGLMGLAATPMGLLVFILCAILSMATYLLAVRAKRTAETVMSHAVEEITVRLAMKACELKPADTLLRGATRPTEKQESVLLRAARDGPHESEAEQLLRPGDALQ